MKITVEYTENVTSTELHVLDAKYIGDYVIRIYFNSNENKVASGVYFYRLETNNKSQTQKMLLVK